MVVVLIAASGAEWESPALGVLTGHPGLVVLKRCVDVDDLLATASAGQADAAVIAVDAPGLDVAAVDDLRRYGVRPVVVLARGQLDQARLRAHRIGVSALLVDDDLATLPGLLARPDPPSAPPVVLPQPASDEPSVAAARGRVIVVWGPAGAPGRTTVATALAEALARRSRTTLVDADPYGGSVAQVLGILDEVSGLLAAARLAGAGQLAEEFAAVQRALDPHLTVVTGLPRADRWPEVRAGTVESLLAIAATRGHAVADTGFSLEDQPGSMGARPGRNQMTLGALSAADEVVVVGTADPVGLSRLARGLVDLRELLGAVPVRVVVNRMRPSLGWSEREVADMVTGFTRTSGLHFLPEDRPAADRALVTGRTLSETSPDSPLVAALQQLADALVPGPPPGRGRRPRAARTIRPRRAGRDRLR